ncbi:MAG TPA: peptidoglycan-binding protein [Devosia sp.]|jgi:lysozyme|nr:peptidoglycan-binding protein [Devosia sp.]
MSIIKTISDQGDAALVSEEGDVLRAYRCPAGVWTIGTGLTAASGVVKPKRGMVITREESRQLRRLALARNYEPRVVKALPTDKQHVFDGAVMFDFNTGAINRASWVGLFLQGAKQKAMQSFLSWTKGGGKTLPGLVKRRRREWAIIEFANYGTDAPASSLSAFIDHWHEFKELGFDPAVGAVATVTAFQRKHGLTVDGLIGPATRAALERILAAKRANKGAAAGATAGGAAGGGSELAVNTPAGAPSVPADAVNLDTMLWIGGGIAVGALVVYGASLAWRYRGPLFAWLPEPVKDWFEHQGVVLGRRVRT